MRKLAIHRETSFISKPYFEYPNLTFLCLPYFSKCKPHLLISKPYLFISKSGTRGRMNGLGAGKGPVLGWGRFEDRGGNGLRGRGGIGLGVGDRDGEGIGLGDGGKVL